MIEEIKEALTECIKEINSNLIDEDKIQSEISRIEIESAILEIKRRVNNNSISTSDRNSILFYLNACRNCLMTHKCIDLIDKKLRENSEFNAEMCNYIMDSFDIVVNNTQVLLKDEALTEKFTPFICHIGHKLDVYRDWIMDILDNKKIK